MAIKRTITCDVTGKELDGEELNKATIVGVNYKRLGFVVGNKGAPIKCITNIENYEFHISADRANAFMEGLKKLLAQLKEDK